MGIRRVAIVGTQGVPAQYGGFETLVENLIGEFRSDKVEYTVFCSGKDYKTKMKTYKGARLKYIPLLHANGIQSVLYDIVSLIRCIKEYDTVLLLGVSGGIFIPVLRLFYNKKLIVNIDGREHTRAKWGFFARTFLKLNEVLAVKYADVIIADNKGIQDYVTEYYHKPSALIAYGGDQALRNVPEDSLPLVPTMVEVQILTNAPKIEQEEINRVKDELRSYTERVNNGETSFSTLARFYSQDPGSARQGGELGYMGRGMLDPAFAAVAFNLTDPSKISKIVESDFGYHIIQLIDRRGDKINCRHILLKPRVSDVSIENAKCRLDSIANDIREGKFTFDLATSYLSDDKDTKSNNGLMVNSSESSRTSRFRMQDLPSEVAQIVDTMKVGEISKAFQMVNDRGKTVCAIVKLKSRIEAHKATITEDFQVMKDVVMAKERQETLQKWVENKIKNTYVRMNPDYDGCDFEYQGWIK